MKGSIVILFCIIWAYCSGQQWQQIDASDYTVDGSFSISPYSDKNFKISQQNNSIWMSNSWSYNSIRQFDPQGNFYEYSYFTEGTFTNQSNFSDIEFAANKVFVVSSSSGLHQFDGSNWSVAASYLDGLHITSDKDSLWVTRSGDSYFTWKAGGITTGAFVGFKRLVSKSGIMWGSSSEFSNIASFTEVGGAVFHSPDTTDLMSWNNYDFKFAKLTDTLYSASEKGLSLAHDGVFFDSITPGNSINMPAAGIIEFEFDNLNNIWAIFQVDHYVMTPPTHIGYYDQSLNEWTQIFDQNNSPLNFNKRMTIEVDSAGNPWIINDNDLFVLKINNWPTWLDVVENEKSTFNIYPNPTNNIVNFVLNEGVAVSEIQIRDVSGKIMKQLKNVTSFSVDELDSGLYYIVLMNQNATLGFQKLIVQ